MSIVSRALDTFSEGINPAFPEFVKFNVRYGRPVGFHPGDPQYPEFTQNPQKPFAVTGCHFRKPAVVNPVVEMKRMHVPLATETYGHHAGAMLFYAPEPKDIVPLKVPYYKETDMKQTSVEEYDPSFPFPFAYNEGIKPGIRAMRELPVDEPTPPMFRPQKVQYKHEHAPSHFYYRPAYEYQLEGLELEKEMRNL